MKTYRVFTYNDNKDPRAAIEGFLNTSAEEGYEVKDVIGTQVGYALRVVIIMEKEKLPAAPTLPAEIDWQIHWPATKPHGL